MKDRASALKAYRARMTYGMPGQGGSNKPLTPPENSELLLTYAYPSLTPAQGKTVLTKTAIEDGYPYDHSSQGWQRINLAAALSSRVTLDTEGRVVGVAQSSLPQVVRQVKKESKVPWVAVGIIIVLAILVLLAVILIKRHASRKTNNR